MPRKTSTKLRRTITRSRKRPSLKRKIFTLKNIIVAVVAVVVVVGGAAAFALSQMNQDLRNQAYAPEERCSSRDKGSCNDGCTWRDKVYNCSNFEGDSCPSECDTGISFTCTGKYVCGPVKGALCTCTEAACKSNEPGCRLKTRKTCTGGSFTRNGEGSCSGTPNSGGGGNTGGGNTGGGNTGGGNTGGGNTGGGNTGGGNTGGGNSGGGSNGGGNSGGGSNGGGNSGGGGGSTSVRLPKGYFDVVNGANVAYGWACDPDNFNQPLEIHFYVDDTPGKGTFIGKTTANVGREEGVGKECGGRATSGFAFPIPSQYLSTAKVQDRKIFAYAIDIGPGANDTNKHLSNSPLKYKTVAIDTTPASGTYSSSCSPASGQNYGDLRYELKVTGTTPKNVGSVVFFLGFFGKQHSKELTDDFLGKPTWSETCHDQSWCGYWLKQVSDPNPGANETISWTWSGDHTIAYKGGGAGHAITINELANKIAELKKSGKLPADYKLAVHVEYRMPDGSKYKFDGKDTQYLDITPTGCGASAAVSGVGVVRAKGTLAGGAYPIMEVRKNNQKIAGWTVTNQMKDYTFEVPANTKISDLTVAFVNDFSDANAGQDRNLEVDYLKIGSSVYQSEAASTYSNGSWGEGGCAPGYKKSQLLACNGFFRYAQ